MGFSPINPVDVEYDTGHREIQVSVSLFTDFALQVDMLLKILKAGKHVIQAISEVETPLSCYNSICNNPSTQTIWAVAENYRFEPVFVEGLAL
ncbi:hypothetical protein L2E82_36029 [Cichorium intybus]|uniref:Uncharacterized protein n=1 Tax=Cichorium intybus TaxID=13427 RepID=A0ACB9BQD7_CICIN|nr:hypothetical protein L2E82_36029 [Cichorium intybus]